jgi:methyltransferase (TIGR00027 family)
MALFRALESRRRGGPRLVEDPLAPAVLSGSLRTLVRGARIPFVRGAVEAVIDTRWPGARTSGVARTRLLDEWVLAAIRDGARQVVILGAGFDARAQRLAELRALPVVEIDREPVLARKRQVLASLGIRESSTYLPLDFGREGLADALRRSTFDPDAAACFLWEGVTNYLSEEAVVGTLRDVASLAAPGSRLFFTYVHRGVVDGTVDFEGAAATLAAVTRAGEPWTFGLYPDQVESFLAPLGYRLLEDVGSRDYRRMHLPAKPRYLRGYEFYRAAAAEVSPES